MMENIKTNDEKKSRKGSECREFTLDTPAYCGHRTELVAGPGSRPSPGLLSYRRFRTPKQQGTRRGPRGGIGSASGKQRRRGRPTAGAVHCESPRLCGWSNLAVWPPQNDSL
jgi:hypothetical protein